MNTAGGERMYTWNVTFQNSCELISALWARSHERTAIQTFKSAETGVICLAGA